MTENETEVIDSPTDTETTENNEDLEINLDEEEPKEDVEALKKEIKTLQFQKEQWREKATSPRDAQLGDISTTDLYSLVDAKVSRDDVPDVKEYAKIKGISVTEALKTSFIKTLLKDKEETRATARATNVANGRRSNAKLTDEALIAKASKGEVPESDEDIVRLIQARREATRQKRN